MAFGNYNGRRSSRLWPHWHSHIFLLHHRHDVFFAVQDVTTRISGHPVGRPDRMFRSRILDAALARSSAHFFLGSYRDLVPSAEWLSVSAEKSIVLAAPLNSHMGELTRRLYRGDCFARYLCGRQSPGLDYQ